MSTVAAGAHCARSGTVGASRAARWVAVWALLAQQERISERIAKQSVDVPASHVVNETLEVIKDTPQERISKIIPEQTVDEPVPKVELAEFSGVAGSSCSGATDTTSAASTAVAKSADEARLLGIANHSAMTESELAKSSGGAGSSWSGANCTTSASATTVEKSVDGAGPLGTSKCSAMTESELAESSDERVF